MLLMASALVVTYGLHQRADARPVQLTWQQLVVTVDDVAMVEAAQAWGAPLASSSRPPAPTSPWCANWRRAPSAARQRRPSTVTGSPGARYPATRPRQCRRPGPRVRPLPRPAPRQRAQRHAHVLAAGRRLGGRWCHRPRPGSSGRALPRYELTQGGSASLTGLLLPRGQTPSGDLVAEVCECGGSCRGTPGPVR